MKGLLTQWGRLGNQQLVNGAQPKPARRLSDQAYSDAISRFPIVCVDFLFVHPDGRVLLARRQERPLEGEMWVVGGAQTAFESIEVAADRLAQTEVGLALKKHGLMLLGIYDRLFPDRAQAPVDEPCHGVVRTFVYKLSQSELRQIKPNVVHFAAWDWVRPRDVQSGQYQEVLVQMIRDYRHRRLQFWVRRIWQRCQWRQA